MMLRLMRCKLHLAAVTDTMLNYHGSITIPEDLLEATGLHEFEVVTVANTATGQRAETYILKGERGSGRVQMNGAMARLGLPGDRVIVFSYAYLSPEEAKTHHPTVVIVDESNRIVEKIVQ